MLRGLPRWMGLIGIAVVAFVVGVVIAPVALVPVWFEESRLLREYLRYLEALVTLEWWNDLDDGGTWVFLGVVATWAGLQALFLSPIVGPPRLEAQGRSLVPSVVAAAFVGSLGCAFAWVAVVEGLAAFLSADQAGFDTVYGLIVGPMYLTALVAWIGCGFAWYVLLKRAGSTRDPAGLDRFVRRVFAGTCVELLLGVVCYLQVRRKTNCYCAMGSFWSLVFGAATLLWMCGPWAVLLVTRRERMQWARSACRQCGYPRRTEADVCPECGARHLP